MRYGWRGVAFVLVVVLVGLGLAACAPTRITDLHTTQVACHRVDLAWTAATVPGGTVASYTVMRDGASVATVMPPATGYGDTSVAASRSYNYTIQAFNTKGEASAVSNAVPVNTPACPPTGTMVMYCRAQKMSAQADKDQAYQRCGYVQDGIGSLCSARAKNVPAKLGYYDDLDAADPSYSGPEKNMYDLANASHESWFIHDSSGHRIEYAGYSTPNFDPYDTGNSVFIDQWSTFAKQVSCADFVFADNTGAPDGYSSAKPEYSSRVGGVWTPDQQFSDGAASSTRLANDLGSEPYCGNFGKQWYVYDSNGVVDQNVRNNYLAQPCTMVEDWLLDFGDLPPTSPNEDGAFGDSGFYNALKGFDIAWDVEQHGKAMIYGCTGNAPERYALYRAATGLLLHQSVLDSFGGCIDATSEMYPWYSTNLGFASGNYFCAKSGVSPTPPADVTGPLGNAHCGLYERSFANGVVFANLSGPSEIAGGGGTTYTLTFPKAMKNVQTGTVGTSFQVAPKRGLILQST